ncbi:hypothetical protein CcBV_32.10 [Bracoviriform congregatae]|uniref:Uncharacterized protein n=1 Tax=Bracoviriform congregatae TaxID=39640 RepID=Q5ZNT9_9VIRU|nr:hypothetical protein CcBV_32.10 [Bracoviriform congregatae]CAG18440.1 hypothetical protein CcBV_32.10 [Bracoviriform congregatae]
MADRKISRCRLEKSKEASGNVVSRFFRRLSPTKSYRGNETPGSSSSSTIQASRSRKKDSSAVKNSSGRIMSEKKSCQKPIIEENKRKVCEQAKVAKPSRTLEKLEEARKIVTDLQEEQKPDTDFKANLTGQNQKLIAFRRITGNKTRLFK